MLTIRPYCNEDPPRLLEIWRQNRCGQRQTRYAPLSVVELDCGLLGMPFFDRHCLQLAFHGEQSVGFAQAGLGPNADGSGFSSEIGHIAVVAVLPDCEEPTAVCKELIQACENVLTSYGVHEIFGGSPHPSLPFYLGLYGGAEPIAIFDSDMPAVEAFLQLDYAIHKRTIRFERELAQYNPPILPNALQWRDKIHFEIDYFPAAKNWWDALSLAHCEWIEFTAILTENDTPVARSRVRLSLPGDCKIQRMYDNGWDAALMDIRVHPDFHRKGLGTFVLETLSRFLAKEEQTARIEAHIAEDCSPVYGLLRALNWTEVETGTIFAKKVR